MYTKSDKIEIEKVENGYILTYYQPYEDSEGYSKEKKVFLEKDTIGGIFSDEKKRAEADVLLELVWDLFDIFGIHLSQKHDNFTVEMKTKDKEKEA